MPAGSVDNVGVELRFNIGHVDGRQILGQDIGVGVGMDLCLVEVIRPGDVVIGHIAGGLDVDSRHPDVLEDLEERVPCRNVVLTPAGAACHVAPEGAVDLHQAFGARPRAIVGPGGR